MGVDVLGLPDQIRVPRLQPGFRTGIRRLRTGKVRDNR